MGIQPTSFKIQAPRKFEGKSIWEGENRWKTNGGEMVKEWEKLEKNTTYNLASEAKAQRVCYGAAHPLQKSFHIFSLT